MYYPKSKIETNLFSSGELYITSTGQSYYGSYFKTFDGKLFTGKEPNDGSNQPLTTQPPIEEDILDGNIPDYRFTPENATYSNLTKPPKITVFPIPFTPQPTQENYQTGEITRFFAKKRNETLYYEVADSNVSSNPMYFTFNLQWVINGEKSYVMATNEKMVELYMRQLPIPSFNQFLKNDYLKFWKPS